MPKTLKIAKPLLPYTDSAEFVEVSATTIEELLVELQARFPGVIRYLLDENGEILRFTNFYVNREDIRFLNNRKTLLNEGDEITIIPGLIEAQSAKAVIAVANDLDLKQKLSKN